MGLLLGTTYFGVGLLGLGEAAALIWWRLPCGTLASVAMSVTSSLHAYFPLWYSWQGLLCMASVSVTTLAKSTDHDVCLYSMPSKEYLLASLVQSTLHIVFYICLYIQYAQ